MTAGSSSRTVLRFPGSVVFSARQRSGEAFPVARFKLQLPRAERQPLPLGTGVPVPKVAGEPAQEDTAAGELKRTGPCGRRWAAPNSPAPSVLPVPFPACKALSGSSHAANTGQAIGHSGFAVGYRGHARLRHYGRTSKRCPSLAAGLAWVQARPKEPGRNARGRSASQQGAHAPQGARPGVLLRG